jgi:hypothetical protein
LHGYVFPDHAQYATQHFSPNGIAYSAHLAMPTRELFIRQPLKAKARNGRVMFTKSGADTNKIMEQWRVLPSALQQLLRDCTEELYHSSTQDFLPVIQKLAEPLGLHIMGNSNAAMVLIRELDQFIRFDRSNRIAKAACRFPVDIFGTGWDHFDWPQNGNVRFHGSLTWLDIMKQLPQYLGCLSTNPLVEQSVHDRVFFALSAGVVPVSNANNFSRKNMPLLSPYSFDQSEESVASALDAMLTNPDDALEHTESTWAALTPRYTLHHSVRQIVDFCKMASFNTVVTPEMK